LESATLAHGDVDLICRLNTDRALDALADAAASPARLGHAAAHACLGSDDARSRVLRALSAPEDADVLLAQAYFRHRPIDEVDELRLAAARVAAMAAGPAQVRALETLARFHVSDADTLDRLARLFQRTTSLA